MRWQDPCASVRLGAEGAMTAVVEERDGDMGRHIVLQLWGRMSYSSIIQEPLWDGGEACVGGLILHVLG